MSAMVSPKQGQWPSLLVHSQADSEHLIGLHNRLSSEFSSRFDYIMVFGMNDPGNGPMIQTDAAKTVISAMLQAGLEVFPYLSVQKDELYCLIRAPVSPSSVPAPSILLTQSLSPSPSLTSSLPLLQLEKLREFADTDDFPMAVSDLPIARCMCRI
jgi:hypothetical protein